MPTILDGYHSQPSTHVEPVMESTAMAQPPITTEENHGAPQQDGPISAGAAASKDASSSSLLPVILTIQEQPIYFRQDWAAGIGGGLWSTGLAMAKYLQSPHALRQIQKLFDNKKQRGLNVLELGSGNGLLAACWLALAKQQEEEKETENHPNENKSNSPATYSSSSSLIENLVVTDTQEHLALIRQTMEANSHLWQSSSGENGTTANVHVLEHLWGEFRPGETDDARKDDDDALDTLHSVEDLEYDLIVGSDVAYHERLYDPLIASLQYFCQRAKQKNNNTKTTILLGCTMSDTTSEFFDRLYHQGGFVYQRIQDQYLSAEYQGSTFGLFVVQPRES